MRTNVGNVSNESFSVEVHSICLITIEDKKYFKACRKKIAKLFVIYTYS